MTELRDPELRGLIRARPQTTPSSLGPRQKHWLWPATIAVAVVLVVALAYLSSTQERATIEVKPPPYGEAVPDLIPENPSGPTAELFADWAAPIARRTHIPKRALMAYANAVAIDRHIDPDCGIGWTTLAGIASKESSNGQHGNATVLSNGDVRPKIRGHAWDGTDGTDVMLDTWDPSPDGKPVYVRAMGPFQFIPETWHRNAVDGNGDGVLDPDNIDDAAATAAHYLCSRGGNMTTPKGWRAALHAYNPSIGYLLDVRERATTYADGLGY